MTKTRICELATKRLILRPFQPGDATAVQTLCSDPMVARMTSRIPNPLPSDHAARWIAGHDALRDSERAWTFCIAKNDQTVGAIDLRRDGDDASLTLGYWLGVPYWHRGYATEAAKVISQYGFGDLAANAVCAGVYVDNPASARVLEKCGFRYTHTDSQWCEARHEAVACRRYRLADPGIGPRVTR